MTCSHNNFVGGALASFLLPCSRAHGYGGPYLPLPQNTPLSPITSLHSPSSSATGGEWSEIRGEWSVLGAVADTGHRSLGFIAVTMPCHHRRNLPKKIWGSYGERRARAYTGDLRVELLTWSMGRAPGRKSGGEAPPHPEAFLTFTSANGAQICPNLSTFYPVTCSNIPFERILLHFCLKLFYWSLDCDKKWVWGSEA